MKRRWIIAVGLLAVCAICAALFLRSEDSGQKAVKETRRALRQQGFKTDLADFDFTTPPEMRARVAVLTNFLWGYIPPKLMTSLGPDSAIVMWRHDWLPGDSGMLPYLNWDQLRGIPQAAETRRRL